MHLISFKSADRGRDDAPPELTTDAELDAPHDRFNHFHIIPIMSAIVSRALGAARLIGTLSTLTLWFRMRVINSMSMLILIPFVRTATSTSAPRHHRQISVGKSASTVAQSFQTSKYGSFHGVAHISSAQLGTARRAVSTDPLRDGKVLCVRSYTVVVLVAMTSMLRCLTNYFCHFHCP